LTKENDAGTNFKIEGVKL